MPERVAFGVGLVLMAVSPTFVIAVAAVTWVGAASAGFQAMNNSLVLALSDLEYHGRVQSLLMLGFSGFGLAALPLGLIADAVGLRETLVAMGVLVAVISTISVIIRRRQAPRPAATL